MLVHTNTITKSANITTNTEYYVGSHIFYTTDRYQYNRSYAKYKIFSIKFTDCFIHSSFIFRNTYSFSLPTLKYTY
jgi:hypothetical protein